MNKSMRTRNLHIYELYATNHMTMAAIGRRVGLSRERGRQIIRQYEAIFEVYRKAGEYADALDAYGKEQYEKSKQDV